LSLNIGKLFRPAPELQYTSKDSGAGATPGNRCSKPEATPIINLMLLVPHDTLEPGKLWSQVSKFAESNGDRRSGAC